MADEPNQTWKERFEGIVETLTGIYRLLQTQSTYVSPSSLPTS